MGTRHHPQSIEQRIIDSLPQRRAQNDSDEVKVGDAQGKARPEPRRDGPRGLERPDRHIVRVEPAPASRGERRRVRRDPRSGDAAPQPGLEGDGIGAGLGGGAFLA